MAQEHQFSEKKVTWEVDGIEMEGTLLISLESDRKAGLVFVAGSGPTDRDWCSPLLPGSNGSGRLIAEYLARNGFHSLRYDKRASGPHVMENLPRLMGKISMKSHLDELAGAVRTFASSGVVENDRIFALTNSEGGIHALNYQLSGAKPKFKGLALTGFPASSIGEVAREQMVVLLNNDPKKEDLMKIYDRAIQKFLANEDAVDIDSAPDSMKQIIMSLRSPANLPFSRELWNTEPIRLLEKISEPTLIIIGKKDLQVDCEKDGRKFREFADRVNNIELEFPVNANHVLKEELGEKSELDPASVGKGYNSESAKLDQWTMRHIITWLESLL